MKSKITVTDVLSVLALFHTRLCVTVFHLEYEPQSVMAEEKQNVPEQAPVTEISSPP